MALVNQAEKLYSVKIQPNVDAVKIHAKIALMTPSKSNYHHGNLRKILIETATELIRDEGLSALSLRKLAATVGVSRTALYHHFKNKDELLCAIAIDGFEHWHQLSTSIFEQHDVSQAEMCRQFIKGYIHYASTNREMYDLMFGRAIWQQGIATDGLKNIAYPCFQVQVEMTRKWQEMGLMDKQQDTLRLAQVNWATLHGLARLLIDGIYGDASHIDEMCETALSRFFL